LSDPAYLQTTVIGSDPGPPPCTEYKIELVLGQPPYPHNVTSVVWTLSGSNFTVIDSTSIYLRSVSVCECGTLSVRVVMNYDGQVFVIDDGSPIIDLVACSVDIYPVGGAGYVVGTPFTLEASTGGCGVTSDSHAWTVVPSAGVSMNISSCGPLCTRADVTVSIPGDYTFCAESSHDCEPNPACLSITVMPAPCSITAAANPTIAPPGTTVDLSSTPIGMPLFAYSWASNPPVVIPDSTSQNTSVILNEVDTYDFTVTMTDSTDCTSNDTIRVVIEGCNVTASAGPAVGPPGTIVSLSCIPLGTPPFSCYWTNSDPSYGIINPNSQNASVKLNTAGTYTLTVAITDGVGCVSVDSAVVTIEPKACSIIAAANPTGGTPGTIVSLSSTPTGVAPFAYQWTCDPPVVITDSDSQNASATLNLSGPYTFTVTMVDDTGCTDNDSVVVPIVEIPPPPPPPSFTLTAVATPNRAGLGTTINLIATITVRGSSVPITPFVFSWTSSPSVAIASADSANASATPTATGIYTFTVVAQNGVGTTLQASADATIILLVPLKVSPSSLLITLPKNTIGHMEIVELENVSPQTMYISIGTTDNWYSTTLVGSTTLSAGDKRNLQIEITDTSQQGTFSHALALGWKYAGGEFSYINLPIQLIVTEKVLFAVNAGPDITRTAGQFTRQGTVSPPPSDPDVSVNWVSPLTNQSTIADTLTVDFPAPTGDYQDYTFTFEAYCPGCAPAYGSDSFVARIVKDSAIITSLRVLPSQVTVNLASPPDGVTFSPEVLPLSVVVSKYRWYDSTSNPRSIVPADQSRKRVITITNWAIVAGSYQINLEIETSTGLTAIASAIVIATGESSTTEDGLGIAFPSEDALYDVDYFIVDTSDKTFVSTLEDIPQQTVASGDTTIPIPCAHPSVCVAHNNKRTGSNEQYIYIVYQAFWIQKWEIYLRQIRLSGSEKTPPSYEAPYSETGIARPWEIETSCDGTAGSCNVEIIDAENGKKYWADMDADIVYESDLDGSNQTIIYTYVLPGGADGGGLGAIGLDLGVTPRIIYISTYLWVAALPWHKETELRRGPLSNPMQERVYWIGYNGTEFFRAIRYINVTNGYVYWASPHTELIPSLLRRDKNLSGGTYKMKDVFSYSDYRTDVDYENDIFFYVRDTETDIYRVVDADTDELFYSVPFSISNMSFAVDQTNRMLYIADENFGIARQPLDDIDSPTSRIGYNVRLGAETNFDSVIAIGNNYIYWLLSNGNIQRCAINFSFAATTVTYQPKDYYVISYRDETNEVNYITRVVYNMVTSGDKVVSYDDYGFFNDLTFTISYKEDLSSYWYDTSLFAFDDVIANSSGSNLTNTPFDFDTSNLYINSPGFYSNLNNLQWALVTEGGIPWFVENAFGACGPEVAEPIRIASSVGHCTKPKAFCNYNNDLFVIYEDTETGKQQIKIVGTGDFHQDSFIGPHGSFVGEFFTTTDFRFSHTITPDWEEGVNQLPNLIVDKNNITHVVWQSNRDKYWEVYYANSGNGFEPFRITKSTSRSMSPSIGVHDDGHIYVAFHDDRFGRYEIMVSHQEAARTLPLLQEDAYLSSLRNDYDHYVDRLTIPVSNATISDLDIQLVVRFYDNRMLSGTAVGSLSSKDNPELFQSESETASCYQTDDGFHVLAGTTCDIVVLANQSTIAFDPNRTYFIKLEYIYPDETVIENWEIDLSYSCTACNVPTEARWTSSAAGFSDTRITDSTENSLNASIKSRTDGKLIILWQDHRFPQTGPRVLGAMFDSLPGINDLRSTGGSWFDYDYGAQGKYPSLALDLLERVVMAYEQDTAIVATKSTLAQMTIASRVCDFHTLPTAGEGQIDEQPLCDYSNITTNVLSDDPEVASQYIKQLAVLSGDVDYYTRSAIGQSIPVVSKCEIKLELTGTPEVVAYRLKNENDTNYGDWIPFRPEISNYYTQISHRISSNSGQKQICVQVATYSGITTAFYLPLVADYDAVSFDVYLTTGSGTAEALLPTYEEAFVAATQSETSLEVNAYIVVPEIEANKLKANPSFDVLQQGIRNIFGINTTIASLPSVITNVSGKVYKGSFVISREDGKYHRDGVARIRPRFDSECVTESYSLGAAVATKDDFNDLGESQVIDVIATDTLSSLRNPVDGRVGIIPDAEIDEPITATRWENWQSTNIYNPTLDGACPGIRLNWNSGLPIYRGTGYSLSMWVKLKAITNGYIYSEDGSNNFYLRTQADGTIQIVATGTLNGTSSSVVCDDAWHHIVWVDDNGEAGLYVDGTRDATDFDYTYSDAVRSNLSRSSIGARSTSNTAFADQVIGFIDEAAAWSIPLKPTEVISIYNSGCPSELIQQSNFIFWSRMGDNTTRVANVRFPDESGNDNYGILYNMDMINVVSERPC